MSEWVIRNLSKTIMKGMNQSDRKIFKKMIKIKINFSFSFSRYGAPYAHFFEGTLEEALIAACHKPAKEVNYSLQLYPQHIKF